MVLNDTDTNTVHFTQKCTVFLYKYRIFFKNTIRYKIQNRKNYNTVQKYKHTVTFWKNVLPYKYRKNKNLVR